MATCFIVVGHGNESPNDAERTIVEHVGRRACRPPRQERQVHQPVVRQRDAARVSSGRPMSWRSIQNGDVWIGDREEYRIVIYTSDGQIPADDADAQSHLRRPLRSSGQSVAAPGRRPVPHDRSRRPGPAVPSATARAVAWPDRRDRLIPPISAGSVAKVPPPSVRERPAGRQRVPHRPEPTRRSPGSRPCPPSPRSAATPAPPAFPRPGGPVRRG